MLLRLNRLRRPHRLVDRDLRHFRKLPHRIPRHDGPVLAAGGHHGRVVEHDDGADAVVHLVRLELVAHEVLALVAHRVDADQSLAVARHQVAAVQEGDAVDDFLLDADVRPLEEAVLGDNPNMTFTESKGMGLQKIRQWELGSEVA